MLEIIIFNVEHGQCIFFYPQSNPEYGMFIDCGNTPDFEPIDFLIKQNLIHHNGQKYVLGNLTLTNYDHDHFSGIPHLRSKAHIWTIQFAKNLNSQEIIAQKPQITDALKHICDLKENYTFSPVTGFTPPYVKEAFSLTKSHLSRQEATINNLSQMAFVEYGGNVICIAGDLEKNAWEILLKNNVSIKEWLARTDVLIAAHHGRENGYAEEIFDHCFPECVVISDKTIMHGTQEGMSQTYSNHVLGDGVVLLSGDPSQKRKVLTTRSDGNIWIRFGNNGIREYRTFSAT